MKPVKLPKKPASPVRKGFSFRKKKAFTAGNQARQIRKVTGLIANRSSNTFAGNLRRDLEKRFFRTGAAGFWSWH